MLNYWDNLASVRSEQIESERDITFTKLFIPYYKSLVNHLKPKSLLDIGSGTGHLLKVLREYTEVACGLEPSAEMVKVAKKVLKMSDVVIENCFLEQFETSSKFDLAISHLCVQAVDDLAGFLSSARKLLDQAGHLSFSIPHPCFWNNYQKYIPLENFQYMEVIKVKAMLSVRGIETGLIPYIHRPLNTYFRALSKAGYRIIDFDEIYPSKEVEVLYGESWELPRYANFLCAPL